MRLQSKSWYHRNILKKNKMENWIDVKDRLPDYGIKVLVVIKDENNISISIQHYGVREWMIRPSDPAGKAKVIYWMPLPNPPVK